MLQVFAFEKIGVVLSDLYFVDPSPQPGQDGPERGVRLEVRVMAQGELTGSIYSSRPIEVGRPVYRVDLLETAEGPAGSLNRAHHHPAMHEWEPGSRVFDRELSADPVSWLGGQLADLEGLLERAGIEVDEVLAADAESLRGSVPDVQRAVRGMLDGVKEGRLGLAPEGELSFARVSWL